MVDKILEVLAIFCLWEQGNLSNWAVTWAHRLPFPPASRPGLLSLAPIVLADLFHSLRLKNTIWDGGSIASIMGFMKVSRVSQLWNWLTSILLMHLSTYCNRGISRLNCMKQHLIAMISMQKLPCTEAIALQQFTVMIVLQQLHCTVHIHSSNKK